MSHTCRTISTFSLAPREKSFHYKVVKMHEAVYNAQGRFHTSENKADTRHLTRFSYYILQIVRDASARYTNEKLVVSDNSKEPAITHNLVILDAFLTQCLRRIFLVLFFLCIICIKKIPSFSGEHSIV